MDHFYINDMILLSLSALCIFHFHCSRHFLVLWLSWLQPPNHSAIFTHHLVIFPPLSFSYFPFLSPPPRPPPLFLLYFLIFISPLQMDEVIIGVESAFLKNELPEIFDPTKWFFWGRLPAKYFSKMKPFPISFHLPESLVSSGSSESKRTSTDSCSSSYG